MKQRDYKREYQNFVARGDSERYKKVSTTVPKELYESFKQKAEDSGEKMGSLIREWIEDYLRR